MFVHIACSSGDPARLDNLLFGATPDGAPQDLEWVSSGSQLAAALPSQELALGAGGTAKLIGARIVCARADAAGARCVVELRLAGDVEGVFYGYAVPRADGGALELADLEYSEESARTLTATLPAGGDIQATSNCPGRRLGIGETCAVSLRFTPTSVGAKMASGQVAQTAGDVAPLPFSARGTGRLAPAAAPSDATRDAGLPEAPVDAAPGDGDSDGPRDGTSY